MKHTSTVLETSIPFHTLSNLVEAEAEDIVKDKIRTHDHTLGVNSVAKQLQTQRLYSSQNDQVYTT